MEVGVCVGALLWSLASGLWIEGGASSDVEFSTGAALGTIWMTVHRRSAAIAFVVAGISSVGVGISGSSVEGNWMPQVSLPSARNGGGIVSSWGPSG